MHWNKTARLLDGPYANITIDASYSLCELLLFEKGGWGYVRRGILELDEGPLILFQWERLRRAP